MRSSFLSIRDVRKSYGTNEVLAGVDLDLRRGEVLGVVGRNGVGKSTLASIIAGTLPADGGEFLFEGNQLASEQVMLIDPEERLDARMSVAEALFRQNSVSRDESEVPVLARRALAEAGVALLPDDSLGDLSLADRRMVEVVRILADPRDIIVIDELSNALNALEVEDLRYALQRSSEEERGVIYITHRLDEALRLCHRIAVIRDGQVVEVFNSLTASVEELTEAIFGGVIDSEPRRVNATETPVLEIEGLSADGVDVSFTVHGGEIVGFCGERQSGVETIREVLLGRQEAQLELRVSGQPASLRAPRDLPGLGIAVLASLMDPENESHAARNFTMMDGDTEVDDATIEDTTRILMALRESELEMSRLLHRSVQSTGERRWQQMQKMAGLYAKIMILIEPLEALDAAARERFVRLMEEITARGVGVLVFASDEADTHLLSDRVLVVSGGGIRAEWSPADVPVETLRTVSRGEWIFDS